MSCLAYMPTRMQSHEIASRMQASALQQYFRKYAGSAIRKRKIECKQTFKIHRWNAFGNSRINKRARLPDPDSAFATSEDNMAKAVPQRRQCFHISLGDIT